MLPCVSQQAPTQQIKVLRPGVACRPFSFLVSRPPATSTSHLVTGQSACLGGEMVVPQNAGRRGVGNDHGHRYVPDFRLQFDLAIACRVTLLLLFSQAPAAACLPSPVPFPGKVCMQGAAEIGARIRDASHFLRLWTDRGPGLLLGRHRCGSRRPGVQAIIPEELLSPTSPAKTSNNQQPGALVRPSAFAQPVGPAMALDRSSRLPGCLIGVLTSHIKTGRLHSRTPRAASHTPASLGSFSCVDVASVSISSPNLAASASPLGPQCPCRQPRE